MSLSGSSEKYGQFLHDQPIMQNQTDAKSLKAFKLLGNPNDFCKLFFLSFLEINPNMQELDRSRAQHVRIIYGWELPKAFAHMRDIVWSFYNERSICKAL